MTRIPRNLIPLEAVAWIAEAGRRIEQWIFNPRCTLCGERTPGLEGHYAIEHVEPPGSSLAPEQDTRWHA